MVVGYCIRRAGDAPPAGLEGLDGAPVRLIEEGVLGLWVSDGEGGAADPGRLRAHDAVVRAALRSATPLPLRFGAGFRDEERARETLRDRVEEWAAALERVAGRVEMGVQLIGEIAPPTDAGAAPPARPVRTGRDYLEARRGELRLGEALRREAERALDRVAQCFEDLDLSEVRAIAPAPGVVGSLAHLVHSSDLARYRAAANEAARAAPALRLRLSGPWAPYSFV